MKLFSNLSLQKSVFVFFIIVIITLVLITLFI
mgnify:CR=1 FL=1